MDLKLKGKRVFITASTSGIGLATAESFLREGANVIICGRNSEKLYKEVERLKAEHISSEVYGVVIDATSYNDLVSAKKFVKNIWEKIDILVGNLGSGKGENSNQYDVCEWKRLFDINLFSSVQLIDIFKDMFPISGGSIVLMSSIAGMTRIGAPLAYASAKAGVNAFVSYAANDLSNYNIRINAVAPGNVFFEGGRWEELQSENKNDVEKYINLEVPMKRFATCNEISDSVVFLCSEKSSFTNGTVLIIDGAQCRNII